MAISNVNRAGNPNICKSCVNSSNVCFCGSPSDYYLEYNQIHEIYFTEKYGNVGFLMNCILIFVLQ